MWCAIGGSSAGSIPAFVPASENVAESNSSVSTLFSGVQYDFWHHPQ
jgi:hypothetical protein